MNAQYNSYSNQVLVRLRARFTTDAVQLVHKLNTNQRKLAKRISKNDDLRHRLEDAQQELKLVQQLLQELQFQGGEPELVEEAVARHTALHDTVELLRANASWTSNLELLQASMDMEDLEVAIQLRARHVEAIETVLQARNVGPRVFKWRALPTMGLG